MTSFLSRMATISLRLRSIMESSITTMSSMMVTVTSQSLLNSNYQLLTIQGRHSRLSFFVHSARLQNITSSALLRKSACISKFSTKIDLLLCSLHQQHLFLLLSEEASSKARWGVSKSLQSIHDFSGFLLSLSGKLKPTIIGLLINPCALPLHEV